MQLTTPSKSVDEILIKRLDHFNGYRCCELQKLANNQIGVRKRMLQCSVEWE